MLSFEEEQVPYRSKSTKKISNSCSVKFSVAKDSNLKDFKNYFRKRVYVIGCFDISGHRSVRLVSRFFLEASVCLILSLISTARKSMKFQEYGTND